MQICELGALLEDRLGLTSSSFDNQTMGVIKTVLSSRVECEYAYNDIIRNDWRAQATVKCEWTTENIVAQIKSGIRIDNGAPIYGYPSTEPLAKRNPKIPNYREWFACRISGLKFGPGLV